MDCGGRRETPPARFPLRARPPNCSRHVAADHAAVAAESAAARADDRRPSDGGDGDGERMGRASSPALRCRVAGPDDSPRSHLAQCDTPQGDRDSPRAGGDDPAAYGFLVIAARRPGARRPSFRPRGSRRADGDDVSRCTFAAVSAPGGACRPAFTARVSSSKRRRDSHADAFLLRPPPARDACFPNLSRAIAQPPRQDRFTRAVRHARSVRSARAARLAPRIVVAGRRGASQPGVAARRSRRRRVASSRGSRPARRVLRADRARGAAGRQHRSRAARPPDRRRHPAGGAARAHRARAAGIVRRR